MNYRALEWSRNDPTDRLRICITYLKYHYLGRGRRNFYSDKYFFYSRKMNTFLSEK